MEQALREEKEDKKFRSEVQVLLAWLQDSIPRQIGMTREAIRTYPRNSLAHFNLGSLLERDGRIEEAMESYLKSVKLDSNNAWGLVSLARIHMQSEDARIRNIEKAVALAQQANRLSKYREPSIFKTLARAYSEAGRFAEAMRTAGLGLELARQQNLSQEIRELEVEMEVYRLGKSFTWAVKNSGSP
jgi:tetratricopeptide (TPR) repeat protein